MKPRLAFFITRPPLPVLDGTRQLLHDELSALSRDFIIDIWLATDEKVTPAVRKKLTELSGGRLFYYYRPKLYRYFKIIGHFFSSQPWQIFYFYSSRFAQRLTANADQYDAFYFHTLRTGRYLAALEKTHPEKIANCLLDFNDALSLNYRAARVVARGLWKIIYTREEKRLKNYELDLISRLDQLMILTANDKRYLENNWREKYQAPLAKTIIVRRYGVADSLLRYQYEPQTNNLVFIGNLHYPPNQQGLKTFCRHVWPLLLKNRPDIKLLIIGRGGQKFRRFPNVESLGFMADPYKIMTRQALGLNPVEFGGGVSTKSLVSFALGLPLIATKDGLTGLENAALEKLTVIIDYREPQKAAELIAAALENVNLREAMSRRGQEFIRTYYRQSANQENFLAVVKTLVDRGVEQPNK